MHGVGPDAEMMCRFFESAVKCMVLFDSSRDQGREQKEVMEVFSSTLVQTELIIFQEVIEHRMEFFFTELIRVSCPRRLLSVRNTDRSTHNRITSYSSYLKLCSRTRMCLNILSQSCSASYLLG